MEHVIYEHMAETIRNHRTWVDATTSRGQYPYLLLVDGLVNYCYSDILVLQVYRPAHGYSTKQKWIIPEFVLETNVRKIKEEDKAFWYRYCQDKFTLQDIERLVKLSTYGIVDLELDQLSLWD